MSINHKDLNKKATHQTTLYKEIWRCDSLLLILAIFEKNSVKNGDNCQRKQYRIVLIIDLARI